MSEQKQRISDEELKQKLVANSIQSEDYKFPTETIELPSKGYFYDPEGPLASGTIELKYPTAREEDILTSQNLIKNGTVIDKFLQSIIVSKINYNDLLIGDKNAIMVAGRILAYGSEYEFETKCPACGEKQQTTMNLSECENKEIDFDKFDKGQQLFEMKLPASKRTIEFQLMTHGIERKVDQDLKVAKKRSKRSGIDPELTTRMKRCIVSVDGNTEPSYVNNFIDNEFLSRDAQEFRKYIKSITPDVDMTFHFECQHCDYEEVSEFPITAGFFWPDSNLK